MILDEIFGYENFRNHIIWKRSTPRANTQKRYSEIVDHILMYAKSDASAWNQQFTDYQDGYVEKYYSKVDERTGKQFQPTSLLGHVGVNPVYEWRGISRPWRYPIHRLEELDSKGLIYWSDTGEVPRLKRFLDEQKGLPVQSLWTDIPPVNSQAKEDTGYATQKPETLLERIINASSNEGDLVADFFCGSGTALAVSEKLGRNWIGSDLGRFAVHTTRKRMLSIPNVRPFVVQNLGKYERQIWAGTEFGDGNGTQASERQHAYTQFILKLASATPISGYTWLHGVKSGRMVHGGAVDAPISVGDVTQIAAEFKRAVGTGKDAPKTNGVDVLGWDFAFEVNEVAKQQAAAANIQMRFLRIPRDVMDKRAVEQGDIHFFELGALSVDVKAKKRNVSLTLTDFVIPPDDVPEDARKAVKHWSQWIDYWAVDWDNKGDTFHNEWQTYRTRKDKTLALETTHAYAEQGDYTVVVKVIDILGNDTTKTAKVKVE